MKIKIANVVGARPNFMKIAPLVDEMKKHEVIEPILVHTGQHYDEVMSKLFFDDLGLPKPDIYLGIGSAGHGAQTGMIMVEFERVLQEHEPDVVLVVGDVNSTIACGLVAVKMGVRLAHVEAGLRSYLHLRCHFLAAILTLVHHKYISPIFVFFDYVHVIHCWILCQIFASPHLLACRSRQPIFAEESTR